MPTDTKYSTAKKWRVTILQAGKLGFFKPATYGFPVTGIPCDNPVCVGGGFNPTRIYDRLIEERSQNNLPAGESVPCSGMERISKRDGPRHVCLNTLNVKVEIEYHKQALGNT
jgi:hypothetical protein